MKIFDEGHRLARQAASLALWAAPAIIMSAVFLKFFVVADSSYWQEKYVGFSVPAFTYPGGDARNIQLTAYCNRLHAEPLTFSECYSMATPVTSIHIGASVPPYNYPAIWSYIYGLFNDFGEDFFMYFWKINASMLIFTVFLLSLRTSPAFFPLAAFSPAMLLVVERGNIDAITFSIMYIPVLLSKNLPKISSLFIILAVISKVFPIFALPIFFARKFSHMRRCFFISMVLMSPILTITLIDVIKMAGDTSRGFSAAYGLLSILNAPYFEANNFAAYVAIIFFASVVSVFLKLSYKLNLYSDILSEIDASNLQKIFLFYTSILIFGFSFLLFVNWSYRLIFLFPAMFILSGYSSLLSKVLLGMILLIFWVPVLPHGWSVQNLLCYLLFILLAPLIFHLFYDILLRSWVSKLRLLDR